MIFSKTVGYALRGLAFLAAQEEGKPLGIKAMADALEVPKPYMSKIMQELSRRNIINSIKGPNGGFLINENTLHTSILRVIEILDGLAVFENCTLGLSNCSEGNPCPLHAEMKVVKANLINVLENKHIADLKEDFINGKALVHK